MPLQNDGLVTNSFNSDSEIESEENTNKSQHAFKKSRISLRCFKAGRKF